MQLINFDLSVVLAPTNILNNKISKPPHLRQHNIPPRIKLPSSFLSIL